MKWEFLNTTEERHTFAVGFFSLITGQKIWQNDEELKDMIFGEFHYYGLGRLSFLAMIVGVIIGVIL